MSAVDNYFKVSIWEKHGERYTIWHGVFPFVSGNPASTKYALNEAMAYWCALPVKRVDVAQLSVFRPCKSVDSPLPYVFDVIGDDTQTRTSEADAIKRATEKTLREGRTPCG